MGGKAERVVHHLSMGADLDILVRGQLGISAPRVPIGPPARMKLMGADPNCTRDLTQQRYHPGIPHRHSTGYTTRGRKCSWRL